MALSAFSTMTAAMLMGSASNFLMAWAGRRVRRRRSRGRRCFIWGVFKYRLRSMAYVLKEEVWANLGRGTGTKALAAEGNDESRISPIDKPAAQFGTFIHLGYPFGGMSTQRRRRGTTRVGFHP